MAERGGAWTLASLLALAFAVRLWALFNFPSIHHPDEAFQLFEQGHRLAFGYGALPWEFEDGLRSLVPPYALAALFRVTEPIFGGPEGYIRSAQIVLALLSLVPLAAVYRMARRISPTHGLLAGLVFATWFEIVYFAYRPLTEAVATDFVITALALASRPFGQISTRRLAAIGFCLGMAAMLRVHLTPGLALIALWVVRLDFPRRWLVVILGALPPLLVFGITDWITWGAPFKSALNAVWVNVGERKASMYGDFPFYWYAGSFVKKWGLAIIPLGALMALRLRSSFLWLGFGVLVVASHTLIPHKEYRFIFPAIAAVMVVAGLGSADVVAWLRTRYGADRTQWLLPLVAVLWVALSATLAPGRHYVQNWTLSRDGVRASFWVSHRPDLCGLALYEDGWADTGGYAFLHRNVPIYPVRRFQGEAHHSTEAFNYVLARRADLPSFQPQYRIAWCATEPGNAGTCLFVRPGACAPQPGLTPLSRLPRLGEAHDYD